MQKARLNITLDKDLIEFAKIYAEKQRSSVAELFTQFILNLRHLKKNDSAEIILSEPDFKESLLETITMVKAGEVKWYRYNEVF
jgi:hypothetical protein